MIQCNRRLSINSTAGDFNFLSTVRVAMIQDIPLVSIGFDGYGLEPTLEGLSKTKSKNVILCCIDGFTKHVVPEEMSREEWQKTKDLIKYIRQI